MRRKSKSPDDGRDPEDSQSAYGNRVRKDLEDRELDLDEAIFEEDLEIPDPAKEPAESEPISSSGKAEETKEPVVRDEVEKDTEPAPARAEETARPEKKAGAEKQLNLKGLLFGWLGNLKLIEKISLGLVALIFLVSFFYIRSLLGPSENPVTEKDLFATNLPMKGKLVTVNEIDRYWRKKTDADKTSAKQAYIPEVSIKHSSQGTAFLKVFFQGPKGSIRGDAITVDMSSAPNPLVIHGTEGFADRMKFEAHEEPGEIPWSIVILECDEEKASFSKWNQIAEIKIPPILSS